MSHDVGKDASDYVEFFETTPLPTNYSETIAKVKSFIDKHYDDKRTVVLITSGGTTVPLESRTVRYIDNFSIGSRGATSAEYFLQNGYAVIFMHRRSSLEPYQRHFQGINFLDIFSLNNDGKPVVKTEYSGRVSTQLLRYNAVVEQGTLLSIEFTTLSDYLHLLQGNAQLLCKSGPSVMLYLAAAVSDFYIPPCDMAEHKIQSSNGPLQVHLQLVPKMLRPLVHKWAPKAFVVSFKLETDPSLLMKKCEKALSTYRHQVVIGNLLETRKKEVVIVTPDGKHKWITLSDKQLASGSEIEEFIVDELVQRHHQQLQMT